MFERFALPEAMKTPFDWVPVAVPFIPISVTRFRSMLVDVPFAWYIPFTATAEVVFRFLKEEMVLLLMVLPDPDVKLTTIAAIEALIVVAVLPLLCDKFLIVLLLIKQGEPWQ